MFTIYIFGQRFYRVFFQDSRIQDSRALKHTVEPELMQVLNIYLFFIYLYRFWLRQS